MAIIKLGNDYADQDFWLLARHLKLLDLEVIPLSAAIAASHDPVSDGLCDATEYFIGHGFVAVQRYLTATRTGLGVSLTEAFDLPPLVQSGLSFAAACNAGANYWKHVEEWIETLNKSDDASLKRNAMTTLQQMEAVGPCEEYTCSNHLAALLCGNEFELVGLLPGTEEWRNNLIARYGSAKPRWGCAPNAL